MRKIFHLLKKVYRNLPTPPTSNFSLKINFNPFQTLPSNPVVYELGAKGERGTNGLEPLPAGAKLVCVDIEGGHGVDLVADAHDLHMVPDNSVDLVNCLNLLEHVQYPHKVISEAYRILKPGGIINVNVPFIFPFHADPDDFYRFSKNGILILCEKFECIVNGYSRGPASTMHELLVRFLAIVFCFNSDSLYELNKYIFSWLLFWVKYVDIFIGKYKMAYVIHTGTYFVGRKPNLSSS